MMTFQDALKRLDIEEYGDRILNSNSHGELIHLYDYIIIAETIPDEYVTTGWFRKWFMEIVKGADETWTRPESIFQHILRCYKEPLVSNQTLR